MLIKNTVVLYHTQLVVCKNTTPNSKQMIFNNHYGLQSTEEDM